MSIFKILLLWLLLLCGQLYKDATIVNYDKVNNLINSHDCKLQLFNLNNANFSYTTLEL